MLIIGALSFTITPISIFLYTIIPISTFSGAFVSEIRYCLRIFVVILQELHCLHRFYHKAGPYTGGVRGGSDEPPFSAECLCDWLTLSSPRLLATAETWHARLESERDLSVIDHANATLHLSNLLARVNLLIDMRTAQHAVLAAFSHQPWMHICIFYQASSLKY